MPISNNDKSDARKKLRDLISRNAGEWLEKQSAWFGDHDGNLSADNGMIYARLHNGNVITVLNQIAPERFDMPVVVGRSRNMPNVWQVIRVRNVFDVIAGGGFLRNHHEQHMFNHEDMVPVHRKQIIQLTVLASAVDGPFYVRVYGDIRLTPSGNKKLATQKMNLASYVPGTGAVYVSIESDDNGALSVHAGNSFASPAIASASHMPVPVSGKYTRAHVLLYEGQTALQQKDIIVPMQPDFNPLGYSSSDHVHYLNELYDVDVPNPDDSDVLTYNAYYDLWVASPGGGASMVIEDLTSQIPAGSDHFTLTTQATGVVLLFWNTTYQRPSQFTMDSNGMGLTTSFSPASGDTLVAVHGVGAFATLTDPNAIHKNVPGEFNSLSEKTSLVSGDKFLIEDGEASGAKKWVDADSIATVWQQVIYEDGTSFANFTAASGTWSSDGSVIKQTDTAATVRRARHNLKSNSAAVVFEADLQVRASGADSNVGLVVHFDGSGTGGLCCGLRQSEGDVRVDIDGISSLTTFSNTLSLNTWYRLRIFVIGNIVSVYLDSVLQGTVRVALSSGNGTYIGLRTYKTEGWFKNIRAWVLPTPSSPA